MPITNLLAIDPNKLFENHSIDEIKVIQKKLQAENERKRVELRTIVGERYRDLIEAADTIRDMKGTSEGVIGHIEKMSTKCQELQHQHLIGFKPDTDRPVANKSYYAIAIQIKILLDIPEQIWCAVEEEDFLLGAQLFLLARHIHTGLQLHAGSENVICNVTQCFPVVLRQWNAIGHFREAILTHCHTKLQAHNLTDKETSGCLSTLVLLQDIGSLELLEIFLQLRSKSLGMVLKSEQYVTGGVRFRICSSLQLLTSTITLLHACFIGNCEIDDLSPEGIVWKQLKSIVGRDSPPSVSLLDLKHSIVSNFLPEIVKDFRPSTSERVNPVPPGQMREKVTEWLGQMATFTEVEVSSLLLAVATVRGLQTIREEAGTMSMLSQHWDLICQQLMIPRNLNLWESFYQPHLTRRVKDIIKQNWNSILDKLLSTLTNTIEELKADKVREEQSELNLRWFVWSEWGSDLPQGDVQFNQSKVLGLSMKAKGYSPRVQKLCDSFDTQLKALLTDLQHYLGNDDSLAITLSPGENKYVDKSEVQQHLQTCTVENITRLVVYVRSECAKHDAEACTILLARFLQAMPDLCTNLQKCLSNGGPLKDIAQWQELIHTLRKESILAWQSWRASVSKRFLKLVNGKLEHSHKPSQLLQLMPRWDVVSIEEEGEEGRSVRSDIQVPSQPSLPLQDLLNAACQEINAIAPHTLPTSIHQELIEHFVEGIFGRYEALIGGEGVTQTWALQMSLDVKYLTLLLVPRDNKFLMSKSQEINDKIEDKIDPFDLDVFTPYIQTNIKRSVNRTQCLMGVLIAWPEKLAVSNLRSSVIQNSGEDPNILPLTVGSPWFQLLPVSGPPGQRQAANTQQANIDPAPQRKKATSPKPKVEPSPGEMVRSGAAAFFGAMSTDWFGS